MTLDRPLRRAGRDAAAHMMLERVAARLRSRSSAWLAEMSGCFGPARHRERSAV
jgi:hypothetical protein